MTFRASDHLHDLKHFQMRTVDHVDQRFLDKKDPTRRFLVADETGLGKSMVARGVIARTIERLQDDPNVGRIDILYVCSNTEIARQNLKNLDLFQNRRRHNASRLTLLARDIGDLDGEPDPIVGKRVNLISFTPGTSFVLGRRHGHREERELLYSLLCSQPEIEGSWARKRAAKVLKGNVSDWRDFYQRAEEFASTHTSNVVIARSFDTAARSSGLFETFVELSDNWNDGRRAEAKRIIGELRMTLARASVDALEPDLVILDEFQRFRHLLSQDDHRYREAAELADALFTFRDARVLLLSATPYKPFTFAEESMSGDDHHADFRRTLSFLANHDSQSVEEILSGLTNLRRAASTGRPADEIRRSLEQQLLRYMCRTERPRLGDDGMLCENVHVLEDVHSDDFVGYALLRKMAEAVDAPIPLDYWKSTPFFLNFSDGYTFGVRLRDSLHHNEVPEDLDALLKVIPRLDRRSVSDLTPIDGGNARFRHLVNEVRDSAMWQLLWMPASMPYIQPDGPYSSDAAKASTKRLIFSSWNSTPTAIAALLSHDVRLQLHARGRRGQSSSDRFEWRIDERRPGAMSALGLFWPSPVLAARCDPRAQLQDLPPYSAQVDASAWQSLFSEPGSIPGELSHTPDLAVSALARRPELNEPGSVEATESHEQDQRRESTGLQAHIALALTIHNASDHAARASLHEQHLRHIGHYGPGNIAYRSLRRLTHDSAVSPLGLWKAAATISGGFRRLFNRPDSEALLDLLIPDEVYWRAVLVYCRWGNLEAVLDEYLHHLVGAQAKTALDDQKLLEIADQVHRAMTIRASTYTAWDPRTSDPQSRIKFESRFALRYGSRSYEEEGGKRASATREAFNSPFWPFVLATTSVGQEGIDFHWWCHSIIHWNLPPNPVDFEQREGRVSRYGGHVVRKNLAHLHRDEVVRGLDLKENPWVRAFSLGSLDSQESFGELAPHWICQGPFNIERHVYHYPLSRDIERYEKLKDDLTLYRLTFGQPRQEDMLDFLRRRGIASDPIAISSLQISLRPPSSSLSSHTT